MYTCLHCFAMDRGSPPRRPTLSPQETVAWSGPGDSSMDSRLFISLSSEEQALAEKRAELNRLQSELTERELFLANLKAQLEAFQGLYLREIGILLAQLDEWEARIAESEAKASGTEQAQIRAGEARAQAEQSYAASHGEGARAPEFAPSTELKALYREVVRQVHPDIATDENDRLLRTRLMADANLAYKRGDSTQLRAILEEYRNSPESVRGKSLLADLQRVLLQIGRIAKRLAQIEAEIAELTSSDIALLMAKVDSAKAEGRDRLAEMKRDILRRIDRKRTEFESLISEARAK